MKIMHIVEGFGGGVYSFLVDLCNALSKENEVVLVYSRRDQTPSDFEKDFCKKIKKINIQMKRNISFVEDIKAFKDIYNVIKNEKPDAVHLHSSKAGVLGRVVSKILGYNDNQIFYNPHGYSFLQENISKVKVKIYYAIEKNISNMSGMTIAVSKGEYEEGIKITKKIVRIDNAIDSDELDKFIVKKNSKEKTIIGTLGRITFQKNPELFNDIAKRFPNLEFIWIGDGDLRDKLTSNNITITGWKGRYEAIEIMNKIDIYLQTSLWEGLPISLLEAMYMGKVVIVNNVIGNRDVVKKNRNGFIAESADEFESYINQLISKEEVYNSMSKESRNYIIKNHILKDMINKYEELYKN